MFQLLLLAVAFSVNEFEPNNSECLLAPGEGYNGSDAMKVQGHQGSKIVGTWTRKNITYKPATWYAVDFMVNRQHNGSEVIVENAFAWNIYSSYLKLGWQNLRHVFRTHDGAEPIVDELKFFDYKSQGKTVFSDVKLYEVRPEWRQSGGLELGDGEYVVGNRYYFHNDLKNSACTCQRPFLGSTKGTQTGFKYNLVGNGSFTYRFNLAGRKLLTGAAVISCGILKSPKIAEASADEGKTWREVMRVTDARPHRFVLPEDLFPCDAIRLRVRTEGDEKNRAQFVQFGFTADFDGKPARMVGATKIYNCETGELVMEAGEERQYRLATFGEQLPGSSDSLGVWCATSGRKVMKDSLVPSEKTAAIRFQTAANEAEAKQLVFNPKAAIDDLRVEVADFELAKTTVTILREHYLKVVMCTDAQGMPGWWPDALPEQDAKPYRAEAGEATPFFIRVKPPKGTAKGIYKGNLKVTAQTAAKVQEMMIPFEVEVFGFEFPDKVTVKTPFGFHENEIFRYHKVTEEADKEVLRDKYYQLLAASHITPYPITTVQPKLTWHNERDPEKMTLEVDWTEFDQVFDKVWDKYHFNVFRFKQIERAIGYSDHDHYHGDDVLIAGLRRTDPTYERAVELYLREAQRHLELRGMIDDCYVNPFDEPFGNDFEYVNWQCATLKKYAPKIKRLVTSVEGPTLAMKDVNLWQPVPYHLHSPDEQACRDRGDTMWWYICCSPPGVCVGEHIDHPGIDQRLWLWQTWAENIGGILVWALDWWNGPNAYPDPNKLQDPWIDPNGWGKSREGGKKGDVRFSWCTGEGRYFYPPLACRNGSQPEKVLEGPVTSYRLELLREGIEDYEYFAMLKRLDPKNPLLKVPPTVTKSITEYSTDPTYLEQHRILLAHEIEKFH